jgi:hypothetical protein
MHHGGRGLKFFKIDFLMIFGIMYKDNLVIYFDFIEVCNC